MRGNVRELVKELPVRDVFLLGMIHLETHGITLGKNKMGMYPLKRAMLIRFKEYDRVCQYMGAGDMEVHKMAFPFYELGGNLQAGHLDPLPSIEDSLELFNKIMGEKDDTVSE